MQPPLTSPFRIGEVEIANRVLLAPLAGIGNWFVRLQARRHGAGMAVSEMVSSFGLHYRNERTLRELLRLHPDEHPVSVQLFGQDPEVMRSAAAIVAEAGADLIDINNGRPVRKVCKTGAGAVLLSDPDLAVSIASAARAGGGSRLRSSFARAFAPAAARGSSSRCVSLRTRASRRSASTRGPRPPITRVGRTTRWRASSPSGSRSR